MTWRLAQRIETWPWSKTVILVGIFAFLFSSLVAGITVGGLIIFPGFQPEANQAWLTDRMLRLFETVQESSLWIMGVGGATLAGKRATTKASVIEAQTAAVKAGVGSTTIDGTPTLMSPGPSPTHSTAPTDTLSERGEEDL